MLENLKNPGRVRVYDLLHNRPLLELVVGDGGEMVVVYQSERIRLQIDEPLELTGLRGAKWVNNLVINKHPNCIYIQHERAEALPPAPAKPVWEPERQAAPPPSQGETRRPSDRDVSLN